MRAAKIRQAAPAQATLEPALGANLLTPRFTLPDERIEKMQQKG